MLIEITLTVLQYGILIMWSVKLVMVDIDTVGLLLTLHVFGANVEECIQVEGRWECGWMVSADAVICVFADAK